MRITSASSYLSRRSSLVQDASEAVQNALDLPTFSIAGGGFGASPSWENDFTKQFSQEVRFASKGEGSFQWLTGVFYSKYKSCPVSEGRPRWQRRLRSPVEQPTHLLLLLNLPTQITQRAWFGNASYRITDQFKLTAGEIPIFLLRREREYRGFGSFLYRLVGYNQRLWIGQRSHGLNPMVNLSYTAVRRRHDLRRRRRASGRVPGISPFQPAARVSPAQCLAGLEALGRASAPLSYGPDRFGATKSAKSRSSSTVA